MIYLDANATEPLRPEARAALIAALDLPGNPASVHAAGRAARRVVETARESIAKGLGADPGLMVFTSGGTEANSMALHGIAPGRRRLVGATEHDAVRAASLAAETLPVVPTGALDLAALTQRLVQGTPALVAVMLANNETGVLNPIADIAAICHTHGALLHVDAVQTCGRLAMDMAALGADSLAISAHKLGGPKGVGALILAPGIDINPLMLGGGQERGRRGGTPSVAAIAGFSAAFIAANAAQTATAAHHVALRAHVLAQVIPAGAVLCGAGPTLPNTLCLALPGVSAEAQLIALDLAGVCVSSGAACSSGKVGRSHVLTAMGLEALAGSAIRVSLPWNVTASDVDNFLHAYRTLAARTRATRDLAPTL